MNKPFLITALLALTIALPSTHAADASYKHWRNAMKAAEDARYKRDFQKMREILEAETAEAQKIGSLSSAENAYWLTVAYQQLGLQDLALQTFNSELDRIGPKPTATKLQILRGLLLGARGDVYYRMGAFDKALSSALEGKTVLEDAAGKYHPELYEIHMLIGRIYTFQKNLPEAEKSMKTALKLAQSQESGSGTRWSGAEEETVIYVRAAAPHRVVRAGTDLGDLLLIEKKYDEAESAYKTALESARAAYPKDSIMQVLPLQGMAEVDLHKGRRKEFLKETDQVYTIIAKTPGLNFSMLDPLWLRLSAELDNQNSSEAAETIGKIAKVAAFQNFNFSEVSRKALSLGKADSKRAEIVENALTKIADEYRATAATKAGLIYVEVANFAATRGNQEVADAMFEKAVASQQNAPDKALLIGVLGKLAENKMAAGKKEEALALYHQVSATLHDKYGNDMRVADAMDTEAGVLKQLGQEDAAKELQEQAMDVRKKSFSK